MSKKDQQLHDLCDKLRELNLIVASYETKFASRNIYLDLRKTELDKLKVPEPGSTLMPLDARINKYLDEVHDGKWRDPTQIKPVANFHERPLYFYGSFVSLTSGEKRDFAESEVVNYFKCVISDQNETIEQQNAEIDFLKDLSIEYRTAKEKLERELADSKYELHELKEKIKANSAESIKKIEMLNNNNAKKLMEVVKQREQEKQVFDKELEISELLRTKYHDEHKKMLNEVKDVKQIIQIPRLHYKYLDNLDYQSLRDQYGEYKTKQEFFKNKTNVDRENIRTQRILSRENRERKTME